MDDEQRAVLETSWKLNFSKKYFQSFSVSLQEQGDAAGAGGVATWRATFTRTHTQMFVLCSACVDDGVCVLGSVNFHNMLYPAAKS